MSSSAEEYDFFVSYGTPGQAWLIYLTEKCQTYKLLVQYVVAVCHGRVTKRGE